MDINLLKFYKNRLEVLEKSDLDLDLVDRTLVFDNTFENKIANPIMIIGEAPGANEVEQRKPFVGMAGKNLSKVIEKSGLNREKDFLITNAFPFRTFQHSDSGIKNRTPNTAELKFGATLLLQEIEIVKPKMILLLGGSSKKSFLKIADKSATKTVKNMENHTVSDLTFETINFTTKIGISFHPSPLVYNMAKKREQLQNFFKTLNQYL
ncbi:MAG: uracil-DNA glycosylase [Campylobacterales bacterium]|nr:uracil-DNA glycosylase [Campylobacterales bacterium]